MASNAIASEDRVLSVGRPIAQTNDTSDPGDLLISLQPPPLNTSDDESVSSSSLAKTIPQIILQCGSFANLSDATLRADEISTSDVSENDNSTTLSANNVASNDAGSQFAPVVAELSQLISAARNEAAVSLDFVSLLISAVKPAAGTTSMSPHLKVHVPVGSLGADHLPRPESNFSASDVDYPISLGWKSAALSAVSERFEKAHERLVREAGCEKTYWLQMEEIVQLGEILFKMRLPDYRGLGLRYGFSDAGSNYKEKGFATLRRDKSGKIVFKTEGEPQSLSLSVSILRNQMKTATFITSPDSSTEGTSTESFKSLIKQARDSLFEEELFFEIVRESKSLTSRGITSDFGDRISLPFDSYTICIEMISNILTLEMSQLSHDESKSSSASISSSPDQNSHVADDQFLAEAVSITLHLLLSRLHRRNRALRRKIPLPLGSSAAVSATSSSEILEPLLDALSIRSSETKTDEHQSSTKSPIQSLSILLESLISELKSPQ
ncbi:mediator complex, subunit Med17 [Lipomyces oligophaga]|uniref:mediator complex, subunit Med17 n=1 Tax=Lipomyces oligophaga TaxID=45792 RepID=UPI0034CD5BFF